MVPPTAAWVSCVAGHGALVDAQQSLGSPVRLRDGPGRHSAAQQPPHQRTATQHKSTCSYGEAIDHDVAVGSGQGIARTARMHGPDAGRHSLPGWAFSIEGIRLSPLDAWAM